MEYGPAAKLAKKLETIRCDATLRNDAGEIIGGCKAAQGADDSRIKWAWWYDQTEI